ncbi:MAG: ECF-type sigma factor, partial [Rhodothermales bacterium]|nr:ECF-type sigma factor [Rhodothermales bacterium]
RQGIERALRRAEIAGVAEVPAGIVRADEVAPYGVVRAGLVVQYCFFGGLTLDETAEHMGIAKRSVQRAWTMARAWLRKEIAGGISL